MIGDFNHDGILDMAVASNGEVLIYLGTGKTAPFFKPPQSIAIPGAYCLAEADFNKDGNIDLAVLANGTKPNAATVTTLLGDGAGGFSELAVLSSRIVLGGPLLADFNNDGNLDLAFTGNAISFGNGDGTFGPVTRLAAGLPNPNPFATIATVEDFNGDKLPDLAFPDVFNNVMYILLNKEGGTFALSSFATSPDAPSYFITADVNQDGNTDMICSTTVGDIAFYLGNGNGTFQLGAKIDIPAGFKCSECRPQRSGFSQVNQTCWPFGETENMVESCRWVRTTGRLKRGGETNLSPLAACSGPTGVSPKRVQVVPGFLAPQM